MSKNKSNVVNFVATNGGVISNVHVEQTNGKQYVRIDNGQNNNQKQWIIKAIVVPICLVFFSAMINYLVRLYG